MVELVAKSVTSFEASLLVLNVAALVAVFGFVDLAWRYLDSKDPGMQTVLDKAHKVAILTPCLLIFVSILISLCLILQIQLSPHLALFLVWTRQALNIMTILAGNFSKQKNYHKSWCSPKNFQHLIYSHC